MVLKGKMEFFQRSELFWQWTELLEDTGKKEKVDWKKKRSVWFKGNSDLFLEYCHRCASCGAPGTILLEFGVMVNCLNEVVDFE
jgi:hypothetical protein